MDKILKRRIIGASVLIVSTVVLWPLIFDKPDERFVSEQLQIPEPPKFEKFEIKEPIRPEGIQEVVLPDEPEIQVTELGDNQLSGSTDALLNSPYQVEVKKNEVVEKSETKKTATAKTAEPEKTEKTLAERVEPLKSMTLTTGLTEQGLPKSWAVQVGVFSSRENATGFREQLVKDYYRSDIKMVTKDGKSFAKVFVGPVINKDQALKLKLALDKKYGIKSLVFLYAP